MTPSDCKGPGGDCTSVLAAAFEKCEAAPALPCTVTLAPGTYRMGPPNYATLPPVQGLSGGLTISGTGATILLTNLTGGLSIASTNNLVVEGLTFDMERLPYTLGRVTSVDKASGQVQLAVDASAYPAPSGTAQAWLNSVQAVGEYLPKENAWGPLIDLYVLSDPLPMAWDASTAAASAADTGTATVSVTVTFSAAVAATLAAKGMGASLILRHQVYALNTITMSQCEGVTVRDVTAVAGAGMGLYASMSANITYSNVQVRRAAGRPISITADATHFQSCAGHIEVAGCVFEGQGDDGMNVHGQFGLISAVSADRKSLSLGDAQYPHSRLVAKAGDTVTLRDGATMQAYWTGTLAGLKSGGGAAEASSSAAAAARAAAAAAAHHAGGHVVPGLGSADVLQTAQLTTPAPPQARKGDIIEDLTLRPSVHLVGNTFATNRARGTLLKSDHVLVENCTYDRNTGPAVLVYSGDCFWFESGPVHNWTVRNNAIRGVNYGPGASAGDILLSECTPAHKLLDVGQVNAGVTISGNTFEQTPGGGSAAAAVWSTSGVAMTRNRVTVNSGPQQFATTSCTGVKVAGNVCTRGGQPVPCTHSTSDA